MFAARNQFLVPKAAASGPPTFDNATATPFTWENTNGTSTVFTQAYTAAAGTDVFLAYVVGANNGTPSSVTYNGNAMTLVQSQATNNSATNGTAYLYRLAGGGTGSSANLSASVPKTTWSLGAGISYKNVTGIGTVTTAFGNSATVSTGSLTCPANAIVLAFMAEGYNAGNYITNASGGTGRSIGSDNSGSHYTSLAVNDASATTTFLASINNGATSSTWATIGVVLL